MTIRNPSTRPRESGIELLRILSMLAIVAGHIPGQGGVVCNGFAPLFVSSAGRIAVDVFLIIGCWFMVDAKFRPERIVKIYAEVFMYSVPITIAMVCLGEAGSARNVIQGCIPFFGRSVWFATAYISLIALSPFLNRIFRLPRQQLDRLVVLLFVLVVLVSTVPQFTAFEYLADFALFPVVYIFVGWAKLSGRFAHGVRGAGGAVALCLYTLLCLARTSPAAPLAVYWLSNLRGLPALLCAAGAFFFFKSLKLGSIRFVNVLARSTFAVYVVHQTPAFEQFEWSLFHLERFANSTSLSVALGIVVTALIVFAAVTIVDTVRIHFLEPWYMSTRLVSRIVAGLRAFYGL